MTNLFSRCVLNPVVGLDFDAGDLWENGRPGKWFYNEAKTIRFMALRSEHAPHFKSIKLYCGEVTKPKKHLPKTAWGWKEGQTLAFVIDFLTGTNIDYRVFYNDSAFNSPRFGGLPTFAEDDRHEIDVDILCLASSGFVKNYPEYVIRNHKPKNVVVAHWESFFRSAAFEPRVVPLTEADDFIEDIVKTGMDTNHVFIPVRDAVMTFRPLGR